MRLPARSTTSVSKPDPITRFILAFNPNPTDPSATCIEVGVFTIKGEEFRSFNWWVDYRALHLDPLTESIFHMWPESMKHLVAQWPAFRDRPIPEHLKVNDPDNIVDYLVQTLTRASIFIVRVEYDES